MEALVTGGAGFIGSGVARMLLERSIASVTVLDTFGDSPGSLGHYENIKDLDCELRVVDLRDLGALWALLRSKNFDAIFHQGAISDTLFENQSDLFKCNIESFKALLDYSESLQIPLIYASSAAVYGSAQSPQRVGTERPLNPYGYSKLMMDRYALNAIRTGRKAPLVGLRYFNVYGHGEFFKGKTGSVSLQIAKDILRGIRPTIFDDSSTTLRDFIYIDDVKEANLKALESCASGVFNIGSGCFASFQDVFDVTADVLNWRQGPKLIPNPHKFYQKSTRADISDSVLALNFEPQYSLKQGISEYFGDCDWLISLMDTYPNEQG